MTDLITSTNYQGQLCTLVRENDNQPVTVGALANLHNGGEVRLVGGYAPRKPGSTGRVHVEAVNDRFQSSEFFPSVAGCKWAVLPALTGAVQPAVLAF